MSQPPSKPPAKKTGGFASITDFTAQKPDGQSFFTGGSGTGGCEVYDPRVDKGGDDDAASRIVNLAKGQSAEDHPPPQSNMHKIVMYKNGFIVNDGPLRLYQDPDNAPFLKALEAGYTPKELDQGGAPVDVDLVDKRMEEYAPPVTVLPKVVAFSGEGQSLRSEAPSTAAVAVSSSASKPVVDPSQPTTRVQVRLVDGRRMEVNLNHGHTIRDLRNAIDAENPSGQPYNLQLLFPRKTLTDLSQTIADAGLVGASVQQTV